MLQPRELSTEQNDINAFEKRENKNSGLKCFPQILDL